MDPIYVGKAGYQSLTHAITLGAVGSQAANKKAVLIVSPQWFKENGVKSTAFEAAFSEEEYIALLEIRISVRKPKIISMADCKISWQIMKPCQKE